MKTVTVEVTFCVDIEMQDTDTDDFIWFYVEENGCPGTGAVGNAVRKKIMESEESGFCWGCPGTNRIVSVK